MTRNDSNANAKFCCWVCHFGASLLFVRLIPVCRFRRVREEHDCEANEDHSPGRLFRNRVGGIYPNDLQQCFGIGARRRYVHEEDWSRVRGVFKSGGRQELPSCFSLYLYMSRHWRTKSKISSSMNQIRICIFLPKLQRQSTSYGKTP